MKSNPSLDKITASGDGSSDGNPFSTLINFFQSLFIGFFSDSLEGSVHTIEQSVEQSIESISDSIPVYKSQQTEPKELTPEEIIKSKAQVMPYRDLARNIENHAGEIVYFKGTVIYKSWDNYVVFLSDHVDFQRLDYDSRFEYDVIEVDYDGRMLARDRVEIWGEVQGRLNVWSEPIIKALIVNFG